MDKLSHAIYTLPHFVQTLYVFLHFCLSVVIRVKRFLVCLQRRDYQFFKASAQFSTQHLRKVATVNFEVFFLGHKGKGKNCDGQTMEACASTIH